MKFYVDYRFIVDTKTIYEAGRKVEDFLPEATENIWYTLIEISEGGNEYDDVCCSDKKVNKND